MRKSAAFSSLLLLTVSCAERSAAPAPPQELTQLREEVRFVLGQNCGECHIRSLATSIDKALAVYDLDETDWSAHMTDEQLQALDWRLKEPSAPARGPAELRAISVSEAEQEKVRRYIELELLRRNPT